MLMRRVSVRKRGIEYKVDYLIKLLQIDLKDYCANISIGEWLVCSICVLLVVCLLNRYYWGGSFGFLHKITLTICYTFIIGVTILGRKNGMETSSINKLFRTYERTFVEGAVHIAFEIMFNMLLFFPIGICLSLKKSSGQVIRDVFLLTLGIEGIQLFTGRGALEVADIINNTLGGAMGVIMVNLMRKCNVRWLRWNIKQF